MDRAEFLDEVVRRGYPRDWLFFYPGPDEDRNPESGGIIVAAPASKQGKGRWRTYLLEHGLRDDRSFDDESALYAHLLDTRFARDRSSLNLPSSRTGFLDEVRRRGGRADDFCFHDWGQHVHPRPGQVVVERVSAPDGPVCVRREGDRNGGQTFRSESDAWHYLLTTGVRMWA